MPFDLFRSWQISTCWMSKKFLLSKDIIGKESQSISRKCDAEIKVPMQFSSVQRFFRVATVEIDLLECHPFMAISIRHRSQRTNYILTQRKSDAATACVCFWQKEKKKFSRSNVWFRFLYGKTHAVQNSVLLPRNWQFQDVRAIKWRPQPLIQKECWKGENWKAAGFHWNGQ